MKEHLKTENSKTMNNNNKKRQEEIKEFDETQEKKDKDKILSEMKNKSQGTQGKIDANKI